MSEFIPSDVLAIITGYIPGEQLDDISLVCRGWREAAQGAAAMILGRFKVTKTPWWCMVSDGGRIMLSARVISGQVRPLFGYGRFGWARGELGY
jgi:hypothetical protein